MAIVSMFFGALVFLTGCNAVFCGTTQTVEINSNIPKTAIYDERGTFYGYTPLVAKIPRQAEYLYAVKAGMPKTKVPTGKTFAWFPFILNVPMVGYGIDAIASGGVPSWLDDKIQVTMLEEESPDFKFNDPVKVEFKRTF
ncbi:MAG: hypothetical protein ACRC3H_12235 [Lachnospiraceae bacterium]